MGLLGFDFFSFLSCNFSPGYKNFTVFKAEILVTYVFLQWTLLSMFKWQPDSPVLAFKNDTKKAEEKSTEGIVQAYIL